MPNVEDVRVAKLHFVSNFSSVTSRTFSSSGFSGVTVLLLVDDLSSICSGHSSVSKSESQILLRLEISMSITLELEASSIGAGVANGAGGGAS